MRAIFAVLTGICFGIVLVKSEVASWTRIQAMFRFEEAHMYLVMAAAVAVGILSLAIIDRLRLRTVTGEPIVYADKPFKRGTIVGGILFGMGWAITGACPGPVYAQIGSGAWMALFTFAGVFVGATLYAVFHQVTSADP